MLGKRIIACLDVADGKVVKGVKFANHRVMGDIVPLARHYSDAGVDELVFYDITASPQGRSVDRNWIAQVGRAINIPFCVAGGITSVATAREVLHAGADKISVNTPALNNPDLITELAAAFGKQCVVVGVDSIKQGNSYQVRQYTGDPNMSRLANRETKAWIVKAQKLGAGEIVLNCMDTDGVKNGYHIDHLKEIRAICKVPLIASGGAGQISHFHQVFDQTSVDGALAATVFHSGVVNVGELKSYLMECGVNVRP